MPIPILTFETPAAISIDFDVEVGNVRVIAGDRETTVVEVRPARNGRRGDVEAAERTRVQFADGRLEVRAPRSRHLGLIGRPGAIDLVVQVPRGSHLRGNSSYGDIDTEGQLGDCFLKTSYGTLQVQDVGALTLETSGGNITAGRVAGVAELSTSSGDVRIEETSAPANLKTSAGDVRVERAGDAIHARTAYGGVRVGRAVRGQLDLTTSYGDVDVGVADGTATFLEVRSNHGRVRNELVQADDPPESRESLKVRAQTGYGDIRIRRA
ncbi:MAG: DUF4097 domain-containing protein [Candidatus Dormibacteraeota bacterium]|nr:DUF4097 domain-containing protein [Candidatus Dormibacteraeota bacterium]